MNVSINGTHEAVSLGVIGAWEFAYANANIWRRAASDLGSYGGWRWECTLTHAQAYPTLYTRVTARITELGL